MKIETKYSGEVEINPKNIIHFDQGIPSFETEKEFILLPFSEEPSPFYLLQAIHTPGLAFMVMTPFSFFPDYQAKLSDAVIEQLEIEAEEDVALFTIITLRDTLKESTVNLRGPIIINSKKQKGKQIVLSETDYHTKHALVTPVAAGEEG
ncbi:flagellar assembly protein FliW [Bacillus tamaricis]|uniref:Flagellar assembly factor FliW n=1 Tax=Evansella tamaricis TaxID=2069301 RepID=A0ABS6JDL8_9BACI|nr:flagellar assembly protein FliW [Evansella tamaricis]MBU9711762.1 flagellar assembly protein FliW [Evansella tamaricis]